jgi:hypothetical protein
VAVWPPLLAVTVYRVIADPPLNAGVDHVTVALVSPILAATFVGASGAVAGVTEFEALDAVLVPTALLAVTVNVYVVPLFNPVIVIGDEPPVAVNPPILEVTVYVVIALPPFETGGVNEIVA